MQAAPLLHIEHLSMRFDGLLAIDDLSFTADRGKITALIGPNGAGKTTVFNCITGFYKPTAGRITLATATNNVEDDLAHLTQSSKRYRGTSKNGIFLLERMADSEIAARAKVARTFQNIRLFTGMTVLENLIVAQHNTLNRASGWSILGLLNASRYKSAEKEAVELAVSWLDRINLTDRADDPAGYLPYGDQRRLEIARAMCLNPTLLCLDEPAAGLNPKESVELNGLLKWICQETDTSILLIEHDMSVVMDVSDHIIVLEYGKKISDGPPDFVKDDPKVIAAYLGVEDDEFNAAEAELDT